MKRIIAKKEAAVQAFERHRTFLSISATLLSCAAGWFGYESRVRHQNRLEQQLQHISQELKRDFNELEKLKTVKETARKDIASIVGFTIAGLLMGYTVGRFHGRTSAFRRIKALEELEKRKEIPVQDVRKPFGRVFTKLGADIDIASTSSTNVNNSSSLSPSAPTHT
jgi:hypothetical protein